VNVVVSSNDVRSDRAAGRGHALVFLGALCGSLGTLTEQARSRKKRQDVLVDEADNNSNDEWLDEGRHCVAFL
jgi:hypothetical protein